MMALNALFLRSVGSLIFAIVFYTATLASSVAQAAGGEEFCDFNIEGVITTELVEEFIRENANLNGVLPLNSTVCLNSPGGSFIAGIRLNELFRNSGVRTFVGDGARCESACALAFLGGTFVDGVGMDTDYLGRTVALSGSVGLHAPFVSYSPNETFLGADVNSAFSGAIVVTSYLNRLARLRTAAGEEPLNRFLFTRILETSPDNMYRLDLIADLLLSDISLFGAPSPRNVDAQGAVNVCDVAVARLVISNQFADLLVYDTASQMISAVSEARTNAFARHFRNDQAISSHFISDELGFALVGFYPTDRHSRDHWFCYVTWDPTKLSEHFDFLVGIFRDPTNSRGSVFDSGPIQDQSFFHNLTVAPTVRDTARTFDLIRFDELPSWAAFDPSLRFENLTSGRAFSPSSSSLGGDRVMTINACWLSSPNARIANVNEYVNLRGQPDFSAPVIRLVPLGEGVRPLRFDDITVIGQEHDPQSCINACQAFGRNADDRAARDRAQQCIQANMIWYEVTDARNNRGWVSRRYLEEVE